MATQRAVRSSRNHRAVLVEAMQPGLIGRKPYAVAGLEIEFPDAARRQQTELAGVDIEKGIAAEMLGDRHGTGPTLSLLADPQVFGPDAERGDAGFAGRFAGHKIHLWRSNEASDEEI